MRARSSASDSSSRVRAAASCAASRSASRRVQLRALHGQHRLLRFELPGALGEGRRLCVEFRLLPVEPLGLRAEPLLLGVDQCDRFFPLGRVAPELLPPHFRFAVAVRDRPLLLLDRGGPAFESNQVVLELRAVAVEGGLLVLQVVRVPGQSGLAINQRILPRRQPFRFRGLVGLERCAGLVERVAVRGQQFALPGEPVLAVEEVAELRLVVGQVGRDGRAALAFGVESLPVGPELRGGFAEFLLTVLVFFQQPLAERHEFLFEAGEFSLLRVEVGLLCPGPGPLALDLLLDLLAAAVPDDAVGLQLLGLPVEFAGAADEFRVAAIPLLAPRRVVGVERPAALLERPGFLARRGDRRRGRLDLQRHELRHHDRGLLMDCDGDLDSRQRENVARGDRHGRVRGQRRVVVEDRQDRRQAADADPVRLPGDLADDRRDVRRRQPQVAPGRAADEEVGRADFVADRPPGRGAHLQPDPRQFGSVVGVAGCRQRGHHGGVRRCVRACGIVECGNWTAFRRP
jgi:hypothetical protein